MGGEASALAIDWTPHSWYYGTAIRNASKLQPGYFNPRGYRWEAYGVNGMTGHIVEFEADTIFELRLDIRDYWIKEAERVDGLYKGVKDGNAK